MSGVLAAKKLPCQCGLPLQKQIMPFAARATRACNLVANRSSRTELNGLPTTER